MIKKIKTYLAEVSTELNTKVSWPTWKELQGSAVVVLVASIITAIVVFTMDL
ncbi:MAG: preprotein translocase subunit SecE, partial [Cyclobacteriaceae bacterium]|nr:preprotein translocase subunit SecE [Cyclobacteriaceae bacterium]